MMHYTLTLYVVGDLSSHRGSHREKKKSSDQFEVEISEISIIDSLRDKILLRQAFYFCLFSAR
jgi:hypothetical protein